MGSSRSPSVLETLTQVFRGNSTFAEAVCEGFDLGRSAEPAEQEEGRRERELEAMLGRVAREVAQHPRRRLLYQFLVDPSRLTDDELLRLFEFIYSYLVNAFKGELAEVLSRVVIRHFVEEREKAGDLPPGTVVIEGGDIASWRLGESGVDASWQKGADGLIAVPLDRGWAFHAVVEIKSYRVGFTKLGAQLSRHVERIRLGARIRGVAVDRDRSGFVERRGDGTSVLIPLADPAPPRNVLKLAVRPRSERGEPRPLGVVLQGFWLDELPDSKGELHEAAYLLTAWYIARGAGALFEGTVPVEVALEGRLENSYPDLSPEDAGFECLRRGLYEVSLRETFQVRFDWGDPAETRKDGGKRLPRSDEVFARLYNGICYGVEFMESDRLLTPESYRKSWNALAESEGAREAAAVPPPAFPEDEKVLAAHSLFARHEHDLAKADLEKLSEGDLSPKRVRTRRWLLGMIAFRQGRLEDALAVFPGPEGAADRDWWTRDQLMLSRLKARTGDGLGALAAVDAVTEDDLSRFRALQVERPAARALAAHVAGDVQARDAALGSAENALAELRAERETRKDQRKGAAVDVNPSSVQLGLLDLISVYGATGQGGAAVALMERLRNAPPWQMEFVEVDPFAKGGRAG